MNAKHQFKYTYTDTDIEEISPVDITFDMPGEVTITQMLFNFECYLKACGFVFDGRLEMVEDGYENYLDELDEEPQGGCMADFDKECECGSTCIEAEQKMKCYEEALKESENIPFEPLVKKVGTIDYESKKLDEWNEGLAKLQRDIQEGRDLREKASKRDDELKQMNERWEKISNEEKASILAQVLEASSIEEVKKNKWVHGICNPPSPDWKKNK